MRREYNKAVLGRTAQSLAFIFKTGAPLDDRTAVTSKAALISATAYGDGIDQEKISITTSTGDTMTNVQCKGKSWLFDGLIACDRETGDVYTLYNVASADFHLLPDSALNALSEEQIDQRISVAWRKLATQDTVNQNMQTLSGVFQFKGAADSLSPDKDVITVVPLTVLGSTYNCTGYEYDLARETYSRWETSMDVEDKVFYVNNNKLYSKTGSSTTVLYVSSDVDIYFPTGNQTEGYVNREWQGLNSGQKIYTQNAVTTKQTSPIDFYLTKDLADEHDSSKKFFSAKVDDYEANTFTEVKRLTATNNTGNKKYYKVAEHKWKASDGSVVYDHELSEISAATSGSPKSFYASDSSEDTTVVFSSDIAAVESLSINSGTGTSITASNVQGPNYNVGHVYQIGEKEYASNGLIWVELGSPKEEITWLVINS